MCLEQEHKPKSKNTKLKSRNHKPRNTNPATDLPCQPNTKATNTNPATELKQVKPRWWKKKKKKPEIEVAAVENDDPEEDSSAASIIFVIWSILSLSAYFLFHGVCSVTVIHIYISSSMVS